MSSKKPATPSKKRPPPAAARVTDSSKKAGKAARPRAADGARRKLNFVEDDEEAFVPVVTHRVLGYAEKDARAVPPHVAALFAFVERTCDVPRDFERRHEFGPKSGVSHEERVASAYLAGALGGEDAVRRRLKRLWSRKEFAALVEACAP